MKILPVSVVTEPERRRRFRVEALAAGALNHPNIVAIYDVNLDGDTPYIVLELVDGPPLSRVLAGKPMAVRKLLDAAVQIADGMAAAHRAGIIHRDQPSAHARPPRQDPRLWSGQEHRCAGCA